MSPVPVKLIMTEICAGLAFFLPFSARHWKWSEGRGQKGEKGLVVRWEGVETGGRCPTLRGCTTWETCEKGKTRWRKTQRGLLPWNTPHAFFLYGSMPLKSPCILSKHIIQTQDCTCMDTHTFTHIQVCSKHSLPYCQINHAHPVPKRNQECKHGCWTVNS